jgi:hypothetical protein
MLTGQACLVNSMKTSDILIWHAKCLSEMSTRRRQTESMQLTAIAGIVVVALLTSGTVGDVVASDRPKLKFKSKGPVCMCSSGTSEAEISKAMAERFGKSEGTRLDTLDANPETRDEQRGGVDEAQPR